MNSLYTIVRTEENAADRDMRTLTLDHALWEPDWGIRAGGSLGHDGRNLYVRLWAGEQKIRAEYTAPQSPVCEDSCLELFFMPAGEGRYLNFEINPNGCLLAGFGRERNNRVNALPPEPEKFFRIRAGRTTEGWTAEYRIPADYLRQYYPDFSFTGALRANVYKCGDKTEHPHYLAWQPIDTPTPDFHRPEYFGEMVFG